MAQKFKVKVRSAFAIDGKVYTIGSTADLDEKQARNLLRRGKVELAEGKAPAKPVGPLGTDGEGGAKRQGKAPADEGGGK